MISSSEEMRQAIAEALNRYCFDNIWNETKSEFRNNINPNLLFERSQSGRIFVSDTSMLLPTDKTAYYIYAASAYTLHALWVRIIDQEWISTEDLLNKHSILFHVYDTAGTMIPKAFVYLYKLDNNQGYLVAIDKKAFDACGLKSHQLKEIRFTVYYDSDITNKITVKSVKISAKDPGYVERQKIWDFAASNLSKATIFCNGWETVAKDSGSFDLDQYVDVLIDENIVFSFDVDLTESKNDNVFYSDRDETYKQLIHIPKHLNPLNKVYTHNTLDFYVRKKDKNDQDLIVGKFLHRCAERSVTQVTHNDYGIPMFIMDAYRDYLATQSVTLHIVVRQHDKDNVLVRDKSYIDLLYTQDDDTIIKHLLGKIQENLSFWKASELEKSEYVRMMWDVPDIVTPSNMYNYVEGLGYYRTLSLICKRVIHKRDINGTYNSFTFTKPYLFQAAPVYPVVYKNGIKIPADNVTYKNFNELLHINLINNVNVNKGDTLSVEMFVDGYNKSIRFTPESGTYTISVPFTELIVLKETTKDESWKYYDKTSNKIYEEVELNKGSIVTKLQSDGTTLLLFDQTLYNQTFIIQNKACCNGYSKNIDNNLLNYDPIFLEVKSIVKDAGTDSVPVWYTPHISVYLNGKYLIEGLDFTVQDVYNQYNEFTFKMIIVHNEEYLKSSNNIVEWIISSAEIENEVTGFVVNNQAFDKTQFALYFEEMSMCHIDGILEPDVIDKGSYLAIPDNGKHRQGAPFEIHTCVPHIAKEYLNEFHENDDIERIKIISEYLYGAREELTGIIVLDHSHRIYSSYVAMIIRDVWNGTLVGISFDPDVSKMISQLAPYYNYIYKTDIVVQAKYDIEFVDANPTYSNLPVLGPDVYKALTHFIKYVMPEDHVTSGEIYY